MSSLLQRRRLQLGGQFARLEVKANQVPAAPCAVLAGSCKQDRGFGDEAFGSIGGSLGTCSPTPSPKDDFSFEGILGEGSTSLVHRCRRKRDNLQVAIKAWRTSDSEQIAVAEEEYRLLKSFDHPNIIGTLGFYQLPGRVLTILEYFEGRELSEAVPLSPEGKFTESTSNILSKALFSAVGYLHDQDVLHRDIKPENVRVNLSLTTLKLLDFNTSRKVKESLALTPTGTQLYAAPEVLNGDSPGRAADVWGAGLCAYWMLSGVLPQGRKMFSRGFSRRSANRAIDLETGVWESISAECKDVLAASLALDPFDRSSAEAVLEFTWFRAEVVDTTQDLAQALLGETDEQQPQLQPLLHAAAQEQSGSQLQQKNKQQQEQEELQRRYDQAKAQTLTLEDLSKWVKSAGKARSKSKTNGSDDAESLEDGGTPFVHFKSGRSDAESDSDSDCSSVASVATTALCPSETCLDEELVMSPAASST